MEGVQFLTGPYAESLLSFKQGAFEYIVSLLLFEKGAFEVPFCPGSIGLGV